MYDKGHEDALSIMPEEILAVRDWVENSESKTRFSGSDWYAPFNPKINIHDYEIYDIVSYDEKNYNPTRAIFKLNK